MFSESLEIRQHSTSCGPSGACVGGVAVTFWCSRCSGSGIQIRRIASRCQAERHRTQLCNLLFLFGFTFRLLCTPTLHLRLNLASYRTLNTWESQGCCSHPDLARMEILSMITNSKHPFLSYYYFAWGHSILVTLPAGNVSRLDSRAKKVGYSVSFAASRFSFVVLASSFTVLELQTWAAGLRFLSEQVLRTENSSSFFKMRDIVRDPILHLLFDGRRSRGECGPLRRMNQSRCGGGVLALELEADIKAPAFETSAVHTIVAAFVQVVKGTGLWADVSWVRVWDDAMRAALKRVVTCHFICSLPTRLAPNAVSVATSLLLFDSLSAQVQAVRPPPAQQVAAPALNLVLSRYDLPKRPQTLPNVYIGHRDIRADCERPMFYVESNARSLMFSDFGELLTGIVTVRAFSTEKNFMDGLHSRINETTKFWIILLTVFMMTERWLLINLDLLANNGLSGTFLDSDTVLAGLAITAALTFSEVCTGNAAFGLCWSSLSTASPYRVSETIGMQAVERRKHFSSFRVARCLVRAESRGAQREVDGGLDAVDEILATFPEFIPQGLLIKYRQSPALSEWSRLFPTRNASEITPFTPWLNGGPGCWSMISLFQANGPCTVAAGGKITVLNLYSWNTVSNKRGPRFSDKIDRSVFPVFPFPFLPASSVGVELLHLEGLARPSVAPTLLAIGVSAILVTDAPRACHVSLTLFKGV
ncbi:hypothetical protein B0H14DRAFT_3138595 [Mycena olivaceomarginata]|nr:hypothetical protein B0H14DRAFT_3138595 [Mycena olivaceomarginata]